MIHNIISFEAGREGAGKTTQAKMLVDHMNKCGVRASYIKFPYGSFRDVLLSQDLTAKAQMLLYHADFAQCLEEKIIPLLDQGQWVVLDRYVDSSYVYQGLVRGLPLHEIVKVTDFAIGNYRPQKTILLDITKAESIRRLKERGETPRLAEKYGEDFADRVDRGYDYLAEQFKHRIIRVDGYQEPKEVLLEIVAALDSFLPGKLLNNYYYYN
jgi:dTMP kinase